MSLIDWLKPSAKPMESSPERCRHTLQNYLQSESAARDITAKIAAVTNEGGDATQLFQELVAAQAMPAALRLTLGGEISERWPAEIAARNNALAHAKEAEAANLEAEAEPLEAKANKLLAELEALEGVRFIADPRDGYPPDRPIPFLGNPARFRYRLSQAKRDQAQQRRIEAQQLRHKQPKRSGNAMAATPEELAYAVLSDPERIPPNPIDVLVWAREVVEAVNVRAERASVGSSRLLTYGLSVTWRDGRIDRDQSRCTASGRERVA